MKVSISILLAISAAISLISCQEDIHGVEIEAFEKDKLLACGEIVSHVYNADLKIIDDVSAAFPNKDKIVSKITGDMLSSCINRIDDSVVKGIISDLVFVDPEWNEDNRKYVNVDYASYKNTEDLDLSPETHLLFFRLEKAKNEFVVKNKTKQEKAQRSLPKVLGYDILNVSPLAKILYAIVVLTLIAIGFLYGLGKVQAKKETTKKVKNKKKN